MVHFFYNVYSMKTPKWQYLIAFAVLISITGIVHFSIRLWPGYAYQDYTSQENMLELQPSTTDSALSRFFKQLATTVRNSPIAVVPVETVPNNTIPEYVKATDVQEQINHTTSNVSYAQTTPPTPIEDSTPLSPRSLLSQPTFKPTSLPPCKEKYCMDYLTVSDRNAIKQCEFQTLLRNFNAKIKESKCRFMNGKGRLPVALASTEGCGNTWVRGLLEKVTGICTGFIYCDSIMRAEGFIGDNVKSGSVLVIKTHTIGPQWHGLKYTNPIDAYYGSAVYILRNPHDAAIAEWNRRATNSILAKNRLPHNESHTNVVPKELFGELCLLSIGRKVTMTSLYLTERQLHLKCCSIPTLNFVEVMPSVVYGSENCTPVQYLG